MCYKKSKDQESDSLNGLEQRVSNLEDTIQRLCEAVEKIDLLFDAVTDLKKSVDLLREKMCNFNNSLKDSRDELAKATSSSNSNNLDIESYCKLTESDILFSELHKNDLEIVGVPFKEGEEIIHIVLECARKVDVILEESDLKTAYRGRGRGTSDGIIHVSFENTKKCNQFISKCKASKINTQMIGYDGEVRPVYVNKPLSPFSRRLFYKSKQFKMEFKWQSLWTRNGRIYLKKSLNDKPVQVTCEQDLIALQN